MTVRILPTLKDKLQRIMAEVEGVAGQSVSSWELAFMRDLSRRGVRFGSVKQMQVVDAIGRKVFGEAEWNTYAAGRELL